MPVHITRQCTPPVDSGYQWQLVTHLSKHGYLCIVFARFFFQLSAPLLKAHQRAPACPSGPSSKPPPSFILTTSTLYTVNTYYSYLHDLGRFQMVIIIIRQIPLQTTANQRDPLLSIIPHWFLVARHVNYDPLMAILQLYLYITSQRSHPVVSRSLFFCIVRFN